MVCAGGLGLCLFGSEGVGFVFERRSWVLGGEFLVLRF